MYFQMSPRTNRHVQEYLTIQNEGFGDSALNIKMTRQDGKSYFGYLVYSSAVFTENGLTLSNSPEVLENRVDGRLAVCLMFQLYGNIVPYSSKFLDPINARVDQNGPYFNHGPLRRLIVRMCGAVTSPSFQKFQASPLFTPHANTPPGSAANISCAVYGTMDEDPNPKLRLVVLDGVREIVVFISLNGQIYDGESKLVMQVGDENLPGFSQYWQGQAQLIDFASDSSSDSD